MPRNRTITVNSNGFRVTVDLCVKDWEYTILKVEDEDGEPVKWRPKTSFERQLLEEDMWREVEDDEDDRAFEAADHARQLMKDEGVGF